MPKTRQRSQHERFRLLAESYRHRARMAAGMARQAHNIQTFSAAAHEARQNRIMSTHYAERAQAIANPQKETAR